ncbi:gene transfer agent family protein [Sphingomonas hengshuiensis]|uniref:gene transfer agent family protein n=1 Tax=Sphingomonas hengshuiensis TaxID=1609977 RepID=UPI0009817C8C|nr:gene transfer agent family protein [Sphingomonas hengshuiensis]
MREGSANAARGEAELRIGGAVLVLRPSFQALVAAEGEVGPLFAMVERVAEGRLSLSEMVALFWHCVVELPDGMTRERFADAVASRGLAANMPALKMLIGQILAGR